MNHTIHDVAVDGALYHAVRGAAMYRLVQGFLHSPAREICRFQKERDFLWKTCWQISRTRL